MLPSATVADCRLVEYWLLSKTFFALTVMSTAVICALSPMSIRASPVAVLCASAPPPEASPMDRASELESCACVLSVRR